MSWALHNGRRFLIKFRQRAPAGPSISVTFPDLGVSLITILGLKNGLLGIAPLNSSSKTALGTYLGGHPLTRDRYIRYNLINKF